MTTSSKQFAHSFAKLMFQGKTKTALRLLSSKESGKPNHLNELIDRGDLELMKVRGILVDKHPPSKPADPYFIVDEEPSEVHPVVFDSLHAHCIRSAALCRSHRSFRFRCPRIEETMHLFWFCC